MDNLGKCSNCHHENTLSEFREFYLTCRNTASSATDENEPRIKKSKFDEVYVDDKALEAANQKVLDLEKQLADEQKQQEKEIEDKVRQKISESTTEDIKEAESVARKQEQEKNVTEKLRLEMLNENLSAQLEKLQQIIQQNQRSEISNRDKGEIHERALYQKLRNIEEFGCDQFTRVPKLSRGADTIQTIFTDDHKFAGKILYEAKNTEDWSDKWLNKFISDQSQEGAKFGIIVTNKFPKIMGEKHLGLIKGIFICGLQNVEVVARVLRTCVTEIFGIQCSEENKHQKSEILYKYIHGDSFISLIDNTMNSHLEMAKNRRLLRNYVINFTNTNDSHGNIAQDAISTIIGTLKSVTGAFQNINEIQSNGSARNASTTPRKRVQKSSSFLPSPNQSSIADLFERGSVPGGSGTGAASAGGSGIPAVESGSGGTGTASDENQ